MLLRSVEEAAKKGVGQVQLETIDADVFVGGK